MLYYILHSIPFPSNRHHRSNGDCLEGKRENYQVCCVQYCVQQLYTVSCTHTWTELTVRSGWVLSHWAHFTVLRFIFVHVLFCVWLHIACMCSIVTRRGGPGGIEMMLRTITSFSALTVGWVIWPIKPVPDMTYNVFSGTLNPTQSINLYIALPS